MSAVLVAVLAAAVGAYGYTQFAVEQGCVASGLASDTPADFPGPVAPGAPVVDAAPYHFADFSEVAFPARGTTLTLHAWYAPPRRADGPVVVLSHGIHACRHDPYVLLPAGMLHRAGFGVLIVDLRNHGDSDRDTGHTSLGAKEADDLLGAWDWLVAQGHPAARIGILGESLSADAALDALGVEPRLAAVWADSAYADYEVIMGELVAERGFPALLAVPITPVARLLGETTLGTRSPDRALGSLNGRPLAIVHGAQDSLVPVHHAADLARAAAAGGTAVAPWIVPQAGHLGAVAWAPAEYEARLLAFFTRALGGP